MNTTKYQKESLAQAIEEGRKQIREGQCTVCRTKEDLDNFFDSL